MQIPIQKFRQSSNVFQKPGILSENLKTSTSSDYHTFQYFLLKLCTWVLLSNVYKSVCGICFILFRSWVICKNLKRTGFCKLAFYIFINNSRSRQNKKNPAHTFVDITKSRKRVQNFSKNIKLYGSWSLSKFSIFQTKILVSWK